MKLHTYKINIVSADSEAPIFTGTDYETALTAFAHAVLDTADSIFVSLVKDGEIQRLTFGRKVSVKA